MVISQSHYTHHDSNIHSDQFGVLKNRYIKLKMIIVRIYYLPIDSLAANFMKYK